MPKTMTPNLTALKNQLSQPGAWVWLLTVALPNNGPTLRFVGNTEDVTYGGNVYTAFNFSIGGCEWNTDGEIPEMTMVVTNVGYILQEYMRSYGLIGGIVSYVLVNTDYLAEDYSEDETCLTITNVGNTWPDISLTLSVPSEIRGRVPESRYNPHSCWRKFRTVHCGYVGKAIASVTLSSSYPVQVVMAAAHGFSTGDEILLETTGITNLDGVYEVAVVNETTFTLDGTDGAEYSGSYSSGGLAGYAYCDRIPEDCDARGLFPANYGGPLSLRREMTRYA